jgi:hypothetical protein
MTKETIPEIFEKAMKEPAPPFAFQEGRKVRILKRVVEDGQTPLYFSGAIGLIKKRCIMGILMKTPYYYVEVNSHTEPFSEEELDHRYAQKR